MEDELPQTDITPVPSRPKRTRRPAVVPPHSGALMARIRFLAEHSETVIFGTHAQERMEERGITTEEVFYVLRMGEIIGRILAGIDQGEWKCKVVARPRGSRQLGVATIVLMSNELFIKTVEWEDR